MFWHQLVIHLRIVSPISRALISYSGTSYCFFSTQGSEHLLCILLWTPDQAQKNYRKNLDKHLLCWWPAKHFNAGLILSLFQASDLSEQDRFSLAGHSFTFPCFPLNSLFEWLACLPGGFCFLFAFHFIEEVLPSLCPAPKHPKEVSTSSGCSWSH